MKFKYKFQVQKCFFQKNVKQSKGKFKDLKLNDKIKIILEMFWTDRINYYHKILLSRIQDFLYKCYVKPGNVVISRVENAATLRWTLGRTKEVHPSSRWLCQ